MGLSRIVEEGIGCVSIVEGFISVFAQEGHTMGCHVTGIDRHNPGPNDWLYNISRLSRLLLYDVSGREIWRSSYLCYYERGTVGWTLIRVVTGRVSYYYSDIVRNHNSISCEEALVF